jgi:hypothetical protein
VMMPTFSPWLHWDRRALCEHRNGPGTYLLARFEERPPDDVDPLNRQILLIAETHDQTLLRRWDQFHYSAFKGGSGHAGGCTFRGLFGNGPDTATPPWLYVSATTVPPHFTEVQGYLQDLKNRLLEDYQDRYGLLPCCNVRGPVESPGAGVGPDATGNSTPLEPVAPVMEPVVQFSRWCRWAERDSLDGMDAAGVYALACLDGVLPLTVDILDERTVYIGETCDNSLTGRLWQFNRSAFLQKYGHSGGVSFSSRCAGQGEKLFVSVFPISTLHEPHRSAFIRHTERRLLWEFVLRWGRRPVCNSK